MGAAKTDFMLSGLALIANSISSEQFFFWALGGQTRQELPHALIGQDLGLNRDGNVLAMINQEQAEDQSSIQHVYKIQEIAW